MSIRFRRSALPLAVALIVSSGSAFAQLTTAAVAAPPNYDSLVPPSAGATYLDPVFGSTIKRVSNALVMPNHDRGGSLSWIENEYATMSAFNSDNSRFILVHESYFGLYDGGGLYLSDLPMQINSSSEPRWSRTDNSTLYFHSGNQLKSYDIVSGALRVVHTFSEYGSISGNGEMDISADGDHLVFAGDNRFIFVYQISTDRKFKVFDPGTQAFDSMYITPDNNVIVSWLVSGTARLTGQELFDINMTFLRQVGHADGHKDVTRDNDGAEVLVWTNSDDPLPLSNCNNGIVKIVLATGAQTCLLQLDWSLAVHISAPDGNGTVFVDTEQPSNPEPGTKGWPVYTDEILQVKLDGSGVTRWAHHRSRPVNSYTWQPKVSTSRDGTRVLYASDYDLSAISGNPVEYADTYLLVIGAASGSVTPVLTTTPPVTTAPTPPSPATPPPVAPAVPATPSGAVAPAAVREEQNNSGVSYAGAWFVNNGTFNSGGSAAMAVDSGASVSLSFTGTGVKWIGFSDPWSGIAQVYLDGVLKATVDTYSSSQVAQTVLYSVTGLTNQMHTLKVVATGQHSSNATGAWVWVDAFDITRQPALHRLRAF